MRRLLLALTFLSGTAHAGGLRFPLSIDLSWCETSCTTWSQDLATFYANGTVTTIDGRSGTWRSRRGRITITWSTGEVWAGAGIGDACATGMMYTAPAVTTGEWVGCVNFP